MRHYKNQQPEGVPFVADNGDGTWSIKARDRDGFVIMSESTASKRWATYTLLPRVRRNMLRAWLLRDKTKDAR